MAVPMRYQPQGLARVCSEFTPSGRGIGFVLGPSRSDVFGSRSELAYFGAPAQVANQHGLARKFVSGNSGHAKVAAPPGLIDLAGNFAVVAAFVLDSSTTGRIAHFSDTANNLNFQLVSLNGRLCMVVGTGSNQFPTVGANVVGTVGMPYIAVAGRGPNGFFMYIDGVAQDGGGSSGIGNNVVSADINLGRRGDGTSYFNGQLAMFAYIRGRVDPAPLSQNPWQLFEEDDDESLATIAAAPNSYTLTAAPGTFGLSGSSASVRVSRKLAGGNGSFSLVGGDATLRTGRRVTGATGVITLAGGAATLRAVRRLAAAAGAFTLAGGGAQLVYSPAVEGAVIVTSSGQFALTGSAVAMRVTRRMQAQAASFELAGAAASILYGRRLSVTPGAFVAGGGAAMLRVTRRLSTASGGFALGGSPASLIYGATVEYARAPAGSGYTPQRNEYQVRPAQVGGARPPAIEKAFR